MEGGSVDERVLYVYGRVVADGRDRKGETVKGIWESSGCGSASFLSLHPHHYSSSPFWMTYGCQTFESSNSVQCPSKCVWPFSDGSYATWYRKTFIILRSSKYTVYFNVGFIIKSLIVH